MTLKPGRPILPTWPPRRLPGRERVGLKAGTSFACEDISRERKQRLNEEPAPALLNSLELTASVIDSGALRPPAVDN